MTINKWHIILAISLIANVVFIIYALQPPQEPDFTVVNQIIKNKEDQIAAQKVKIQKRDSTVKALETQRDSLKIVTAKVQQKYKISREQIINIPDAVLIDSVHSMLSRH